jgi:VWFA-related protein
MSSGVHFKTLAAGILIAVALAQEPTIHVNVDEVSVLCSVRDTRGALVTHLKEDDFILLEEGRPQTIRHFARETDLPLTVGLLVDTSNSQVRLIDGERRAAAQFFSQVIHTRDTAFLISFDASTELLLNRSGEPGAIRTGLDRLRENSPQFHHGRIGRPRGTLLYDAVYRAATEDLRREPGRKAIVLITDGMDVGSKKRIGDAIDAAQKADALIYSIYYVDPKAYGAIPWTGQRGQFVLQEMSEQTGGRFYRVDRKRPLKTIFHQIEEEMRSLYALDFVSDDPRKDGSFRRIEVLLREPGLRAQARKGYYAVQ